MGTLQDYNPASWDGYYTASLAVKGVLGDQYAKALAKAHDNTGRVHAIAATFINGWREPNGVDWIRFAVPPVSTAHWDERSWLLYVLNEGNWKAAAERTALAQSEEASRG